MYCTNVLCVINCGMDYLIQTPQQLSAHLRALRRARGLSQASLGESLGVGQTRVARIEGNPTAISVEQLFGVFGALGVQLILRDDQPLPQGGSQASGVARSAPKRPSASSDW